MSGLKVTALAAAFTCGILLTAGGGASAQQATETAKSEAKVEAVILSLDGKVRDGMPIDMTRAALEKLPRTVIRTTTPWHEGVQEFEGVALADLLQHAGASGQSLRVTALNAYKTEIPVSDATNHRPILAYNRNGQPMAVRDKGPLFVIYPYDSDPGLKNEVVLGRSAWQVRSITVQ